jgi:multiple sugar transport system ATP-binding protein
MDGRAAVLGVRPEHLAPDEGAEVFGSSDRPEQPDPGATSIRASVQLVEPLGDRTHLHLVAGCEPIVARVSPGESFSAGQKVTLAVDMSRVHLFAPGEYGRRVN